MVLKPNQNLVAVDTNVALDFAKGVGDVCDAIATIRSRVAGVELLITPTAAEELAHAMFNSPDPGVRVAAAKVLRDRSLGFRILNFIPLGFEQVDRIAARLRQAGLLPDEEVHDSLVVTEAAAMDCTLLTSSDKHFRDIDHSKLSKELAAFDLKAPMIATPREIVRKFFR